MENKEVIDQLRCQREDAGITQMELSLALGYKTNTIYLIESGKTKITVDLLSKLNEMYGWEFELNSNNKNK